LGYKISDVASRVLAGTTAAVLALSFVGTGVSAQEGLFGGKRSLDDTSYVPTIWIDPDGCEHWVFDDGYEGYMSPHTNRQGIPVCRRGNVCGVMESDQFFATNSYKISGAGRERLTTFFEETAATSYIITGHTDARASDEYNMTLSFNRASAVARIAQSSGARIADVRGYGERLPVATNKTSHGQAKNRRVEIICIR
jgi:hypothetical protein